MYSTLEGPPAANENVGHKDEDEVQENASGSEDEDRGQPGDSASDSGSDVDVLDEPSVPPPKTKWRSSKERKPFVVALNEWRDRKYASDECLNWNVTKDWILSTKAIANMARQRGITSVRELATVRPMWIHLRRWGEQLVKVIVNVSAEQDRLANAKCKAKEDRPMRASIAAQESRARAEQKAAEQQQRALVAQSDTQEPSTKRRRISKNATEEEKIARKEELAENRRLKAREKYQRDKAAKAIKAEVTESTGVAGAPPQAGSSRVASATTAYEQQVITFSVKEELVNEQDGLLQPNNTSESPGNSPTQSRIPQSSPITPYTPANPQTFRFDISTAEDVRISLQQSTPISRPKGKARAPMTLPQTEVLDSPSTAPKVRRRPKLKEAQKEIPGDIPQQPHASASR